MAPCSCQPATRAAYPRYPPGSALSLYRRQGNPSQNVVSCAPFCKSAIPNGFSGSGGGESVVDEFTALKPGICNESVTTHANFGYRYRHGGVLRGAGNDGAQSAHFEICPREHTQRILPLVQEVLTESGTTLNELDALAFGRGRSLPAYVLVSVLRRDWRWALSCQ